MTPLSLWLIGCTGVAGSGAEMPGAPSTVFLPPRPPGVTWNDFCGVVYLAPPETMDHLGLGWTRQDFSWNEIERSNDQWNWRIPDQLVMEAHAQGVGFLPLLACTAEWAASKEGDVFSPPRNVSDWEDFVEHVVARYSRPPFNLRYFQVWNEPTWEPLTFWHATGPEWVDQIFLPAAKIIRRYGGRVVFGGWPVADAAHLFQALDYHEAWRWTDIVDIHYFENSIWQVLYDRYIQTGKCHGIWQTEIGFHTFPQYLPNCYLRAAHWVLRHGWTEPNQYKLFWFASWGAGPDAEKCLTGPGQDGNFTLSEHGRRLVVLQQVFGGKVLQVWSDFQTDPPLPPQLEEEASTALGFQVGNQPVVALLLEDTLLQAHSTVRVTLNLAVLPQSLRAVEALGQERNLPFEYNEGKAAVSLATSDLKPEVARGWGRTFGVAVLYLLVEQ